jgi:ElaB/YqjD/DUF883 family membrane-anchored ribosome-binding protein
MDTPKIVPTGSSGSTGNWDNTVEQAKSSAHSTIDKVTESARPAVDKMSSTAHDTVEKVSDSAAQTAAMLSDKMNQLMDMQEQLLEDARMRVRDRPVTALAIAAAAGFIIASLLRSSR